MFSPSKSQRRSWVDISVGLSAFSILPLSGCGYTKVMMTDDKMPRYDASTGTDTAIVADAGTRPFDPACRIVQNNALYR